MSILDAVKRAVENKDVNAFFDAVEEVLVELHDKADETLDVARNKVKRVEPFLGLFGDLLGHSERSADPSSPYDDPRASAPVHNEGLDAEEVGLRERIAQWYETAGYETLGQNIRENRDGRYGREHLNRLRTTLFHDDDKW